MPKNNDERRRMLAKKEISIFVLMVLVHGMYVHMICPCTYILCTYVCSNLMWSIAKRGMCWLLTKWSTYRYIYIFILCHVCITRVSNLQITANDFKMSKLGGFKVQTSSWTETQGPHECIELLTAEPISSRHSYVCTFNSLRLHLNRRVAAARHLAATYVCMYKYEYPMIPRASHLCLYCIIVRVHVLMKYVKCARSRCA